MKLITFQNLGALKELNEKGLYKPKKDDFSDLTDIFCLGYNESTRERLFITAPSYPQCCIVFETDDYKDLDSVSWVNYLYSGEDYFDNGSKYREYTVEEIRKDSVVYTEELSTVTDPDVLQDLFINNSFEKLCKLSRKEWVDMKGKGFMDIIPGGYEEAFMFVTTITNCMIPNQGRLLCERDFDNAIELVNKYFVK